MKIEEDRSEGYKTQQKELQVILRTAFPCPLVSEMS